MLLSLAQWLQSFSPEYGYLRVFQYLTFRAVMAALTALLIGLAAGPAVIRKLTELKIGQPIRGYGIEAHLSKSGTPTMGGVLILLSISFSTLMWVDLSNRFVWIVLLVTLAFGAIGWVDDWRKVVNKDPEGMPSREKYLWQSLIGLLAALYLVFSISEVSNLKVLELFFSWVRSGFDVNLPPKAGLLVPFFKEISYPLGVLGFVVLTYLVIVGSSNAVNLTDGLDGLAIMPVVMVGSALGVFAYVAGSAVYSKYLFFPHIPGTGELLVFCAAIAGAGRVQEPRTHPGPSGTSLDGRTSAWPVGGYRTQFVCPRIAAIERDAKLSTTGAGHHRHQRQNHGHQPHRLVGGSRRPQSGGGWQHRPHTVGHLARTTVRFA